jgi:hypothetical protein
MERTKERMPTIWKSYLYRENYLLSCAPEIIPIYKNPPAPPKCACEWCSRTHPKVNEILAVLPEELKPIFENIVSRMMHAETDAEYYRACLHGDWPGFEWIKEAKIKANIK